MPPTNFTTALQGDTMRFSLLRSFRRRAKHKANHRLRIEPLEFRRLLAVLPTVPGFDVSEFALVNGPWELAFETTTGELYVGRDLRNSGGGVGDPARIHRIGAAGTPVIEYGASALSDPDAVVIDTTGSISGTPGSVLVGGLPGHISAIRPDGSVIMVFGQSDGLVNPQDMKFDNSGRLIVADLNNGKILVSTGGPPSTLVTSPRPFHLAIDSVDRIFTTSADDGNIRVYDSAGNLVDSAFVTGLDLKMPIAFGLGGAFGTDLYALSGGELLRIDGTGNSTIIGTGFPVFAPNDEVVDIAFGPDDALYVSDFYQDRIVRIGPPANIMLSGCVFDDLNNDGIFDGSDAGIAGVTVELVDQLTGTLVDTQTTDNSGDYTFQDVTPGTYKLVEIQPASFLDGDETVGDLGGTVDNTQDSNEITNIVVAAGNSDTGGYNFAEIRESSIQGMVWEDINNDGQINFGELAVENVTISLAGTDDRSNAVNTSVETDSQGIYMFISLRPGDYTLNETQPIGYDDGLDTLGTVNGVPAGNDTVNDQFSHVVLPRPNSEAENYNLGERPQAGGQVMAGQTATIGFWQNNNGRALIESLNGGHASTQLGDWLAATLPNMYGVSAGTSDLTSLTNSQVADFYSDLFKRKKRETVQLGSGGPTKVDAQVMAVALATYVTNETLAGTTAASFGFLVTAKGVGIATLNVGDAGQAFDVTDNTDLSVLDLLFATNNNSTAGVLYDFDGDGDADDEYETLLRTLANDLYSAINETGDR